jgi:hypothetical protein
MKKQPITQENLKEFNINERFLKLEKEAWLKNNERIDMIIDCALARAETEILDILIKEIGKERLTEKIKKSLTTDILLKTIRRDEPKILDWLKEKTGIKLEELKENNYDVLQLAAKSGSYKIVEYLYKNQILNPAHKYDVNSHPFCLALPNCQPKDSKDPYIQIIKLVIKQELEVIKSLNTKYEVSPPLQKILIQASIPKDKTVIKQAAKSFSKQISSSNLDLNKTWMEGHNAFFKALFFKKNVDYQNAIINFKVTVEKLPQINDKVFGIRELIRLYGITKNQSFNTEIKNFIEIHAKKLGNPNLFPQFYVKLSQVYHIDCNFKEQIKYLIQGYKACDKQKTDKVVFSNILYVFAEAIKNFNLSRSIEFLKEAHGLAKDKEHIEKKIQLYEEWLKQQTKNLTSFNLSGISEFHTTNDSDQEKLENSPLDVVNLVLRKLKHFQHESPENWWEEAKDYLSLMFKQKPFLERAENISLQYYFFIINYALINYEGMASALNIMANMLENFPMEYQDADSLNNHLFVNALALNIDSETQKGNFDCSKEILKKIAKIKLPQEYIDQLNFKINLFEHFISNKSTQTPEERFEITNKLTNQVDKNLIGDNTATKQKEITINTPNHFTKVQDPIIVEQTNLLSPKIHKKSEKAPIKYEVVEWILSLQQQKNLTEEELRENNELLNTIDPVSWHKYHQTRKTIFFSNFTSAEVSPEKSDTCWELGNYIYKVGKCEKKETPVTKVTKFKNYYSNNIEYYSAISPNLQKELGEKSVAFQGALEKNIKLIKQGNNFIIELWAKVEERPFTHCIYKKDGKGLIIFDNDTNHKGIKRKLNGLKVINLDKNHNKKFDHLSDISSSETDDFYTTHEDLSGQETKVLGSQEEEGN